MSTFNSLYPQLTLGVFFISVFYSFLRRKTKIKQNFFGRMKINAYLCRVNNNKNYEILNIRF